MNDPHENEFIAAMTGLCEQTISSLPEAALPAIGDWVTGVTDGKRWSGDVIAAEPGRLAVDCGDAWIVVHPRDMTH